MLIFDVSKCCPGERSCERRTITVALIGQPNVGKSTLFTRLTGKYSHVANWPGTTVEVREGQLEYRGFTIRIFDLPGVYGLSASSMEEIVARTFLVERRPDVVVLLVDSLSPERTMYLAIQVLELYPNVVLVFTKADVAHSSGVHIHFDKIEARLEVPVIAVSAVKGYGVRELLDAIIDVAEGRKGRKRTLEVPYGPVEPFIRDLEQVLSRSSLARKYPPRWLAVRLLEGDEYLLRELEEAGEAEVLLQVREIRENLIRAFGRDPVELLASLRYYYIDKLLHDCIVRVATERRGRAALLIDRALRDRVVGPILSLLSLLAMLSLVFTVNTGFPVNVFLSHVGLRNIAEMLESYSLSGLVSLGFGYLSSLVKSSIPGIVGRLLAEGVIEGVGAVLSFFPLILMVNIMLAVLEDSGLAPRFAYALHELLARFGLSGRSVFPLMVGFGCNVPAVMASRTALDEAERMQLIATIPFIPCQARLTVLLALASAFFSGAIYQSAAVVSVYVIAILVALALSLAIRRAVFGEREPPELLIEIPPLHRPSLRVVWWSSWDLTKHFLIRAGVVILGLSLVTWTLLNFGPGGPASTIESSYAAIIGKFLAPLVQVYGIPPDRAWVIAFALLNGLIAKETFLSAVVLASGHTNVLSALRALGLTAPQAVGLMLLVTLYLPCVATLATVYQESRSIKYTLGVLALTLTTAFTVSLTVTYMLTLVSRLV